MSAARTTAAPSELVNRLRKRQRHLERWAKREGTDAYRLFDHDLPGFHFAVDRYQRFAVVAEFPRKSFQRGPAEGGDPRHAKRRAELLAALESECGVLASDVIVKTHAQRTAGKGQYQRAEAEDRKAIVTEGPLRFEVNLGPYLDVGLYLDHRTTRRLVRERIGPRTVLNLFCYTGAFTVAAAAGGAARGRSRSTSRPARSPGPGATWS